MLAREAGDDATWLLFVSLINDFSKLFRVTSNADRRCSIPTVDADAQFLNDFQTGALPFDQWTHTAHIRMAHLVCRSSTNFEEALSKIRQGIRHFNGLHASKLKVGFHETMTQLWATLVWNATQSRISSVPNSSAFIEKNGQLMESSLWKQYYSPALMFSPDAKRTFIPPDLKPIVVDNAPTHNSNEPILLR